MKILLISYAYLPTLGGTEINADLLARGFRARGHDVKIITHTANETRQKEDLTYRRPRLTTILRLAKWADIIFHNNPSLRYWVANVVSKRPVVIAVLTWICRVDGRISIVDRIKQYYVQSVDARIYISRAIASHCCVEGDLIRNPIRREFMEVAGLPAYEHRKNDVIFVGRLVDSKGVDTFLYALAELKRQMGRPLSATIVGDGDRSESYLTLRDSLGLSNSVRFTGRLELAELIQQYSCHKVLVIPSKWDEPFGNVALEGLACGCLPIATIGGGLPDAIGSCGMYFRNGNAKELTAHLHEALASQFDSQKYLAGATAHLRSFTEEVVVSAYLHVFNRVLENRSGQILLPHD